MNYEVLKKEFAEYIKYYKGEQINTQNIKMKSWITKINLTVFMVFFLFISNIVQAGTKGCGLEGYKINFSYDKYEREREIAYHYFVENILQIDKPIDKEKIGIDLYDIGDGSEPQILAYLKQENYCAKGSCPFEIIKKIDEIYKHIAFGSSSAHMSTDDNIIIIKHKKDNLYDICFSDQVIWRWNGKYYFLSELINNN